MKTYESCILVIFRKGDTIKEPIIRFETYLNRDDAETASMHVHDGWTEIHNLTTMYPDNERNIYYHYRGFTITDSNTVGANGYEYGISEKRGSITYHHAPVVGYRNAIHYINKICYQRKFE